MAEHRDYYAFRRGAERPNEGIENLRRILIAEFRRLEHEGYFQHHLGKYCPDEDYIPGASSGSDPAAHVQWELGRDLWPFEESLSWLDEDWVFTVLEFLHDRSAKPIRTRYHDWDNCGLHVLSSDESEGRFEFRECMNQYLSRYEDGYQIQENGEIWRAVPSGLESLVPERTELPQIDDRVQHAIATFRHRSASNEQKRDAVKNLADVLEYLREEAGTGLPNKDEARLFEIANQYAIRHHNPSQKTDYDSGVWLDWIFFAFLNAIALATAIIARKSTASTFESSVGELPFD